MPTKPLTLSVLKELFSIILLDADATIPSWATAAPFFSITRTADEISIVIATRFLPQDVTAESGWKCLKVHGPLEFQLTGILASLLQPLAEARISIFALSTYETDYLLVKENKLEEAREVLISAGHLFV